MTRRRRLVRVPASSANLGPGFDVLAAALALHLELEVSEADEFSVDPGYEGVPADRSNLCVRAFEQLHPADGVRFRVRSEIPLARGLGSSAAAIVAGLFAADHLFELGLSREELYARAARLEGHPDNVAAAVFGGFVICPRPEPATAGAEPAAAAADTGAGERGTGSGEEGGAPGSAGFPAPVLMEPPSGVEAILVIPGEEVPTEAARGALPGEVALDDAVANVAAAGQLVLGIERSDLGLIRRGLADRLHQPHRGPLYPRSLELVAEAAELGAIGATISGAGPTVLVWSFWQDTGKVAAALEERAAGWAEVRRVPFTPLGADVPEL